MGHSHHRRLLAATVALGTFTAVTITSTGGAQAVSEPLVLSGSIPAASDIADAYVVVEPTAEVLRGMQVGDGIDLHVLDAADVEWAGVNVTVSTDPRDLPPEFISDAGVATFELHVTDLTGATTWITTRSVRAIRDSVDAQPQWVDVLNSADAVNNAGTLTYAADDVHTSVPVVNVATAAEDAVEVDDFAPMPSVPDLTAPVESAHPSCRSTKMRERLVFSTLGTTYPVGNSTAHMRVSSSQGAEYGVAISQGGGYGSWSASGTRFSQGTWSKEWLPLDNSRSYQKQVQYNEQFVNCLDGSYYKQLSVEETGGNDSNPGIDRPDWTRWCAPSDPGPWFRDSTQGKAYSYGAAVKFKSVIGVDLSIKRQYSKSQFLRYDQVGQKQLCGNNDWPSTSGKVMERFL